MSKIINCEINRDISHFPYFSVIERKMEVKLNYALKTVIFNQKLFETPQRPESWTRNKEKKD